MDQIKNFTSHHHGDSAYNHKGESNSWKTLGVAVCLTFTFAFVEVVGGLFSHSLALISDAGHMLTDSFSLFFALAATLLSRGAASSRFSFGFAKVEVLASFLNAVLMLFVVGWIIYEAVDRFSHPQSVAGGTVFVVAVIGLLINCLVAWILSRDDKSLNTRAALVHVMGDLLGSVAAIVSGAVIYFGGPVILDPALSILVSLLILKSTFSIIRTSVKLLMDAVPDNISYEKVGEAIEKIDGVSEVHDLHVWDMANGEIALQSHLEVHDLNKWPRILADIRAVLKKDFGISHVTIQPELADHAEGGLAETAPEVQTLRQTA
jgi:cobalt-zinc-cadmium efflux system protein